MRASVLAAAMLATAATLACSKSPTSPEGSSGPGILQGQTLNGVDGAAAPSVSVQIGSGRAVTTDGNGMFEVELRNAGVHRVLVRGAGIVERETTVSAPASERVRFPLIPSSFDLTAFDEMFRTSNQRLQRWMTRPALVVVASTLTYRTGAGDEYEATAEQMSDEEADLMVAQLTSGLALLTGNTFTSFASVSIERPASGTRVNVARHGSIVVGRYNGIVSMVNTIGYGQWSELANGAIVGGAMFLDRDFDRNDPRRQLLRVHELGHALGYQHVRARTSIMNPAIGPEPTDFDRAGATIAFQRLPGNRSPDIDPSPSTFATVAVSTGSAEWKTISCAPAH